MWKVETPTIPHTPHPGMRFHRRSGDTSRPFLYVCRKTHKYILCSLYISTRMAENGSKFIIYTKKLKQINVNKKKKRED